MAGSRVQPYKNGDRTVGTYELNGVHRNNDNGANMGMRCVGIYEIGGTDHYHEQGACIFADKAGDQIMMTYQSKDDRSGTETLVAGTGKFAGISGTGEYAVLQGKLHADDKVNRGIVAERHHWKLP